MPTLGHDLMGYHMPPCVNVPTHRSNPYCHVLSSRIKVFASVRSVLGQGWLVSRASSLKLDISTKQTPQQICMCFDFYVESKIKLERLQFSVRFFAAVVQ